MTLTGQVVYFTLQHHVENIFLNVDYNLASQDIKGKGKGKFHP
jgi:hypothetical protein